MIDYRYINKKLENSKLYWLVSSDKVFLEKNIKFIQNFKNTRKNYYTELFLSSLLETTLLLFTAIGFKNLKVSLILLAVFFIRFSVRLLEYYLLTLGSSKDLKKEKIYCDFEEYNSYNELNLPKELLPDWIVNNLEKDLTPKDMEKILNCLSQGKNKELITDYNKRFFKKGVIIRKYKQIITANMKTLEKEIV